MEKVRDEGMEKDGGRDGEREIERWRGIDGEMEKG